MQLAAALLKALSQSGVKDYIICAGARNAPLLKVLSHARGINVQYFFDERAAAFFALGRARRDSRPVAVVTTSGTAVAELLPAAIEAHYSGVPLVFITADRPKNFRGTGSPQSIEQVGLFSHYAQTTFDLDGEGLCQTAEMKLAARGPTHVNICFAEPLIDGEIPVLDLKPASLNQFDGGDLFRAGGERSQTSSDEQLLAFAKNAERPLVILGGLLRSMRGPIDEILQQIGAPIYAEAQSGLRESAGLAEICLRSGSRLFNQKTFRENFDSVIRIGSVPTLRLWRDLEDHFKDVPVLSVSELPFTGLARQSLHIGYAQFLKHHRCLRSSHEQTIWWQDRTWAARDEALLMAHPLSEPSYFRWLSQHIPEGSLIMLGNSSPIREWDLAATWDDKNLTVLANRGANGIDGLISTFMGLATAEHGENWIILGDLSALYDLNALMLDRFAETRKLRVVVINNHGGQIFQRMFHDKKFLNEHQTEFSKWAEMFGWDYVKFTRPPTTLDLPQGPTVIEIQPQGEATDLFWADFERSLV